MRDIKFRRWTGKEMLYNTNHNHIKGQVLMQYSGLKDRNNKEIYEGDFIKSKFKHDNIHEMGIVEWIWGGLKVNWVITDDDIKGHSDISDFKTDKIEDYLIYDVIGNIYENPELITLEAL